MPLRLIKRSVYDTKHTTIKKSETDIKSQSYLAWHKQWSNMIITILYWYHVYLNKSDLRPHKLSATRLACYHLSRWSNKAQKTVKSHVYKCGYWQILQFCSKNHIYEEHPVFLFIVYFSLQNDISTYTCHQLLPIYIYSICFNVTSAIGYKLIARIRIIN